MPARAASATLPSPCQAAIEHALGEPIGPLTIHVGRAAEWANAARGTLAFACGAHVYLSDEVTRLPRVQRWWVLAHEIAHVVQQRRPAARATSVAAVEGDACAVAWAALRGARRPVRVADMPGRAAAWGEAGHYYTVYVAMLAAGATEADARRAAFFAQMPDEVGEFDAKDRYIAFTVATLDTAMTYTSPAALLLRDVRALARERDALREQTRQIQIGLHCLNGGSADLETEFRRRAALGAATPLEFGLALHAFGDSFAHRKFGQPGTLYAQGLGHCLDGTAPDDLAHAERRDLYLRYGRALHAIGVQWFRTATPPLTADALGDRLKPVTTHRDPAAQIAALKQIAADVAGTPPAPARRTRAARRVRHHPRAHAAVPADETARAFAAEDHGCASWDTFRLANPHLDVHMKVHVEDLARRWTFAPRSGAATGRSAAW